MIGGNGPKYSLPLAARYAQEWNGVCITPQHFAALQPQLDELLKAEGRQPADLRRTLMTELLLGRDQAELKLALQWMSYGHVALWLASRLRCWSSSTSMLRPGYSE